MGERLAGEVPAGGRILGDKYELLRIIGTGGMSVVYLARDLHLKKTWAVKEIRKAIEGEQGRIILHSLLAEADLLKRLDHPVLPRIVDVLDDGDAFYVVMDYIQGETLDHIIRKYGPQREELVLSWGRQLCGALIYLHRQDPPIVYRDMKPSNIILRPEGHIKLIDFGIAAECRGDPSDALPLGTKGYAPPEVFHTSKADVRSDIYSLGMTLRHLLTGEDPRCQGYRHQPVRQKNPLISQDMEAIIEKCTAQRPKDRYPNCEALMRDLKCPTLATAAVKRRLRWHRRLKYGMVAAAALALTFSLTTIFSNAYARFSRYELLVDAVASTPLDQRLMGYEEAISIFPDRIKAYECYVNACEEEGVFSDKESESLLALYNANHEFFEHSDAYYRLHNEIGRLYLTYYAPAGGDAGPSVRIQRAYPFFAIGREAENANDRGSFACYAQICDFYHTYVLSFADVGDAGYLEYRRLLDSILGTMAYVEKESTYEKLLFYHSVFLVLHDQRQMFAEVGIREEEVLALFDEAYEKGLACETHRKAAQTLGEEMKAYYEGFREAICRAYDEGS